MQSRSDMDNPARVTAAVLGVVLIAATIPYFVFGGASEGATTYDIRWTEADVGSAQAVTGAAGSTTTLRVPVTDSLPSNATVTLESCTDGAQPAPVGQPATVTWTLFEGNEPKATGTFTCNGEEDSERVAQEGRPNVGQASGSSASEAERKAYAAGSNETVEYRLEFSWSRPGAGGPLPLPNPAFSATISLTVEEWRATANQQGQEAPR